MEKIVKAKKNRHNPNHHPIFELYFKKIFELKDFVKNLHIVIFVQ